MSVSTVRRETSLPIESSPPTRFPSYNPEERFLKVSRQNYAGPALQIQESVSILAVKIKLIQYISSLPNLLLETFSWSRVNFRSILKLLIRCDRTPSWSSQDQLPPLTPAQNLFLQSIPRAELYARFHSSRTLRRIRLPCPTVFIFIDSIARNLLRICSLRLIKFKSRPRPREGSSLLPSSPPSTRLPPPLPH
ncbi:hypothetical protein GALMADRAFT_1251863 [Galerina marginata CBS 339.88]|uniref:Uncharacterized protein n=1 Tax=Galerina marginata (strain CBS 339.88) TaxID=685588 RepID=A0A067T818_GALM3|nr:hypothetical protein GALMADRAFT_1251863 [Galerina marginata CBS 339.88]